MLEKLPDALGHALRNARAGLEKIAFHKVDLRNGTAAIEVSSLAFADHAPIPPRYTADGEAVSPPLQWRGIPANAASLVLIVEDADSPTPEPLVHAIAVDLEPAEGGLAEAALTSEEVKTGRNSYLMQSWLPPDPPPGHGQHRYAFQIFALAAGEPFSGTPGRDDVLKALESRAIASGCLIGVYERDNTIKVDQGAEATPAAAPADLAPA